MASNRHLGRIITLQSLYEYEFRTKAGDATADIDTIVAKNILPYEKALGDTEFVYRLTHGVLEKVEELDQDLTPLAPEWPISSIAAIDRNVLRMGLFELKFWGEEVPPKVVINEAVELAKAFGADNSSKFVNGVLGTAFKQLHPELQSSGAKPAQDTSTESTNSAETSADPNSAAQTQNNHDREPKPAVAEQPEASQTTETASPSA